MNTLAHISQSWSEETFMIMTVHYFIMPPPLGTGSIMFSGCPSIRRPSICLKPEIPSFHLYMGPLVHPTNRCCFKACPSVSPSVRLSAFRTDQIMVMVSWFSFVWRHLGLVKRVNFGVSGHFLENAWREWPAILHADVSRPPSELISLWSQSVIFSNLGTILT